MSKSKSHKAAKPVDQHAPVHTETMSPLRRWTLIGVAVFCLLIFSVTGSMTTVITGWFGGGPASHATVDLPSGKSEITVEQYRYAAQLREWGERNLGISLFPEDVDEFESNLAYATLMMLGDEMEVVVTDNQIRSLLEGLRALGREEYEARYRSLGFRSAASFESRVRAALRVQKVVGLLSASAVPSESDILEAWAKDYEEMDVQFAAWHPSAFVEASDLLEPTEEELNTFFNLGLTGIQRVDLEVEQAVSFDTVLLTAEALETEAVKAWFSSEEPSEEALSGFYNSNRVSLYRRPAPEEGEEIDPDLEPTLSQEEVGERLRTDYLLHKAISTLALELPQAEDAVAFAAEKGAEFIKQEEMVVMSELADVERIGHTQLRRLFNAELNIWVQTPIQSEGMVYLARPLERRDRAMPELAEIRDDVVALWREGQREDLALEAAQAFIDGLPTGEDHVAGDAVVLDAEAFAAAAAGSEMSVEQMGWISRNLRRTTDPTWPLEAKILPRLRRSVGVQLDELADGQVVGPENYGTDGIVVAHLKGRRAADASTMWPAERQSAERSAQIAASQRFYSEEISFEGLARTYGLTKVIQPENQ